MAKYVINFHMHAKDTNQREGDIPLSLLKQYISYAKLNIQPVLSIDACNVLSNFFVSVRSQHRERELAGKNAIPITVRQLEAIIRISEALAKLRLSPISTVDDVEEAIRLFSVSTLEATSSGVGQQDT